MLRTGILQLRKTIGREEFDHPQLKSALSSYQAIDQKVNDLLKSGAIVRVKKVPFCNGGRDIDGILATVVTR